MAIYVGNCCAPTNRGESRFSVLLDVLLILQHPKYSRTYPAALRALCTAPSIEAI